MINMHLLYFNASYKTGLAAILMPIAAEQRGREYHASATNTSSSIETEARRLHR